MLGLVHFQHLGGQVGGVAVAEFLHGIYAGSFEQLGELRTYALDAEQVGMVYPGEDKVTADAGFLFQSLAAFGACALGE